MLPFEKLKSKLITLKATGMNTAIREVLQENSNKVIKLNTQDQLFKLGVDGNGQIIEPFYAESTKRIKRRKGQPTNRVTLKDTGDFYKSTALDFTFKDFTVINFDKKYTDLREKYGDDILGLTSNNIDKLSALMKLRLIRKIKRLI